MFIPIDNEKNTSQARGAHLRKTTQKGQTNCQSFKTSAQMATRTKLTTHKSKVITNSTQKTFDPSLLETRIIGMKQCISHSMNLSLSSTLNCAQLASRFHYPNMQRNAMPTRDQCRQRLDAMFRASPIPKA